MRRSYSVNRKETATGDQSPVIRLFKVAVARHPLQDMNIITKIKAHGVKTVGFIFYNEWSQTYHFICGHTREETRTTTVFWMGGNKLIDTAD